jgi:hypothetical protein
VPEPDPSERLTLAEQLRLLVSQGVSEEDAKARLGKVFRLKKNHLSAELRSVI